MAVDWTDIANVLTASGIGAVFGGIANSVIQIWGKKGSDRADIAEKLTSSADKWITRIEAENARLTGENKNLRRALISVTDILDELIDNSQCADESVKTKLKRVNKTAKDAVI